jgi:hypothetical protein
LDIVKSWIQDGCPMTATLLKAHHAYRLFPQGEKPKIAKVKPVKFAYGRGESH